MQALQRLPRIVSIRASKTCCPLNSIKLNPKVTLLPRSNETQLWGARLHNMRQITKMTVNSNLAPHSNSYQTIGKVSKWLKWKWSRKTLAKHLIYLLSSVRVRFRWWLVLSLALFRRLDSRERLLVTIFHLYLRSTSKAPSMNSKKLTAVKQIMSRDGGF